MITELLDSIAATVTALHMPYRPEWSPVFGLLVLYSSLAAVSTIGHVAAANLGAPRLSTVRLNRARTACAVSVVFFGLALIVAGLPLGEYL